MTEREKQQIVDALSRYVERYPSQRKAAASLDGVSAATLSTILAGKWDAISDDMWRKISDQVGAPKQSDEWVTVETAPYQEMQYAMDDAQRWKSVTWVVGEAGCGKTTSARVYASSHREAFYVLCSEDMHRSDFLRIIAQRVGLRVEGMTMREMLDAIISSIVQMESPVLLFDEADKLSERVFHYFIDLYNRLEDRCGMVFFSTSYIKRRMQMGLRYDKKGYNEIHSRIGRKFFELEPMCANDVWAVCVANGLTDRGDISDVVSDAEQYDYDLRRVKKAVHRARRMKGN